MQEEDGRLLQNKSISVTMDGQIAFVKLYKTPCATWSLLMASGYVKPISFDPTTQEYAIALTNYKFHLILEERISDWFTAD
ncbi:MAG: hypothetical protein IJU76_03555 [Desulfovibrionaceae bacterium]|nr:hypothetical protein [Desulfovibrionaceae bacterium]